MLFVLSEDRALGSSVTSALHARGIPSLWATPDVGLSLCQQNDTGGVFLDGRAHPSLALRLCDRLLSQYPSLPIALLVSDHTRVDVNVSRILRGDLSLDLLLEELSVFFVTCCGGSTTPSTYHLRADPASSRFFYLGYPLELSAPAFSLVSYLFHRAPKPVSTNELLSACFPNGSQSPAALSSLVSRVNSLSSRISGLPLILSVYSFGYRLADGLV